MYPESDESDKLNTKLLFLIILIWGFTSEIDWFDPPVLAILTIDGGLFLESR